MQDIKTYTLWNGITPKTVSSSTDATPIVITTSASHGYSTGDIVQIFGHTTNIAANGMYKITVLSDTTFSLQNYNTGANIAGTGGGAGSSGVVIVAPKIAVAGDFDSAVMEIGTTGTATMTAKVVASQGILGQEGSQHGDTPNFGATQSAINPWDYAQIIQLSDNDSIDGSTGIVVAGTDLNGKLYEVNINRVKYLSVIITSWTQGAIYAKLTLYKKD